MKIKPSKLNPKLFNDDLGPLNDFKNFLYLVWQFLGLPEPTRIQYDIADYLQYSENPWSIIMAYRGIGKSYITAAFVVWLWMVDAQFKILVISASEEKAKDFAFLVKQIINGMEICEHLKATADQRDSTLSFDVGPATASKDPSMNVYGIGGQITGGRADFIIPDDVEIPGNSGTVKQREELAKKLDDIVAIIKPARDGIQPEIKILGTPQTEQSIYFALESKGFNIRVWPARYPKTIEQYKNRLSPTLMADLEANPKLADKPINPLMHNDEDLKKRSLGRKAWFQLQFMLDPALSDEERYPLKLRDMMVFNVDPTEGPVHMAWANDPRVMVGDPAIPVVGLNGDRYYRPFKVSDTWRPYQHRLMAIDPAGGKDETAYVVLYYLMGYIYIAEWGAYLGMATSTLQGLAEVAKRHSVNTVLVERNFGAADGDNGEKTSGFIELLKPYVRKLHPCDVTGVHNTGQKERRICDTLEPILGAHRLIISEQVILADHKAPSQELQGLWQLTHLTRDRGALSKDDRVDVLAIGVSYFLSMVQQDTDDNEGKLTEEARDNALRHWLEQSTRGQSRHSEDSGAWLSLDGGSTDYGGSLQDQLEADLPWHLQGTWTD